MVGTTFGRTCRRTTRRCPAPTARAASTWGCCATVMVAPRITRELVAAVMTASERITFSRPGPSTAMTDSTMTR